jgi:hypothetical protein
MFIEFQFSTQLFTSIIRNRIRLIDLCLDQEAGGRVIDRVVAKTSANATVVQRERQLELNKLSGVREEVKAATLPVSIFSPLNLHTFMVPYLQVVQEFDIFRVDPNELAANGVGPTGSDPISVRVAFNVELRAENQTQGGGPATLRYTFAWAHFGVFDPFMDSADRAKLEATISGATLAPTTLDLSPLGSVTGGAMTAINAGIALGEGDTTVVLRVDIEVHETPPSISPEFFSKGAPSVLAGQAWAVMLDKDLLIAAVRDRLKNGLAGQADAKPKWGPDVTWEPAGPQLITRAGVEILGACPFFIDDIDLDVDLEVTMGFAIASPTRLALRFHVAAEASDIAEIIGCAVLPTLFWPIAGQLIINELGSDSPIGDFLMGLVLGLPVICGLFASAVGTMGTKSFSAGTFGPHCEKRGDADVECLYPLVINVGDPAFPIRLQSAQVLGTPAGLVVRGPSQAKAIPDEVITVTTTPLQFTISGGCRKGFGFVIQAQIRIASTGSRGGVCSARVLDDPLGEFTVSVDRAENMVTVRARGLASYAALPTKYPCLVRVVTTGGVRTITYPPPAALTPERERELEDRRHNFDQVCELWKDTFHEIEWAGFGPPGPLEVPDWLQHWEVAIHNLNPGEWLDVHTDTNAFVLSAKASARGVTHFAAVFDGPSGPSALRMTRRGDAPFTTVPILTPVQMVLAHRLTIPTVGDAVAMKFEGSDADRRLTIVDGQTSRVFAMGARAVNGLLAVTVPVANAVKECYGYAGSRDSATAQETRDWYRGGEFEEGRVLATSEPRVGGVARPLFVRREGKAALYDMARPAGPELVQLYAESPWFEHTALGGAWVARWNAAEGAVRLYLVAAHRQDGEVPRAERGSLAY